MPKLLDTRHLLSTLVLRPRLLRPYRSEVGQHAFIVVTGD